MTKMGAMLGIDCPFVAAILLPTNSRTYMAHMLAPKLFPDLSRNGNTFHDITSVSHYDDMLILVYRTEDGYCGFVVHRGEKEKFMQENKQVTTNLGLFSAEWDGYPVRLRAILAESKSIPSQPNLEIVRYGITYRTSQVTCDRTQSSFAMNKDAWQRYIRH